MRERDIERKIIEIINSYGGITIKLGDDGWPDRIVLLPGRPAFFLEIKKPGGRISCLQGTRLSQLRAIGHKGYVVYSASEFVDIIEKEYENG